MLDIGVKNNLTQENLAIVNKLTELLQNIKENKIKN